MKRGRGGRRVGGRGERGGGEQLTPRDDVFELLLLERLELFAQARRVDLVAEQFDALGERGEFTLTFHRAGEPLDLAVDEVDVDAEQAAAT